MNNIVLEAKSVSRHYGPVKALNGVSFQLGRGETLAVVGESGCGKSTLARVLTLVEQATSGSVTLDGEQIDIGAKSATKAHRNKVQMVFQNPYGSLNPRKTIASTLDEPLMLNTSMPKQERRTRILDMLAKVGLRPEHADRYPHMFSGGQRQRIAVARALMLEPKVIVLDEPVSALDLSVQAQVLNMLSDIQDEFNLAYVFISHDLSVVEHIADQIMVMYFGQPVEVGSSEAIFSNPQHPYTQALFSATPKADPHATGTRIPLLGEPPSPLDAPSGCAFAERCSRAQSKCRATRPELTASDAGQVACFHPGPPAST